MEISRQPDRWLNAPRPALGPELRDAKRGTDMPIRTLVQMDPPDHLQYRHVSAAWFKPRSIARLEDRATELAKRYVDYMAALKGECDFVTDVAIQYPLYMILSLLGLPEEDFPRMLKLTQEMFGRLIRLKATPAATT
jgi:cytochrome P450